MTQIADKFEQLNIHEAATTGKPVRRSEPKKAIVHKKTNDNVYEAKRSDYEKKLNAADSQIKTIKQRVSVISEEIRTLTASDSNNAAREEVKAKIAILKNKKNELHALKEPFLQKFVALQNTLKSKMDELNNAKEKSQFKRPEDIDRKIQEMEAQVESGSMKLTEEKKVLAEISKLRKLRKDLDAFSGQENTIGEIKKLLDQYKAAMTEKDREIRILDDEMKVLNAEFTKLSSHRSAHQSKINKLFEERDVLRKQVDTHFEAKNAAYEEFQTAQKAHSLWMDQDRIKREEEYLMKEIEYSMRNLEKEISTLDMPACAEEISQCINIQNYLRANILKVDAVVSTVPMATSGSTHDLRKVEKVEDDLILKNKFQKDDEEYYLAPVKKTGKNKKVAIKEEPTSNNVKLPFWVMSGLDALKVNIVSNPDEAKAAIVTLEEVKAKFENLQNEKLGTVDSQKESIQKRIEELKARIPEVPKEALARVQAKNEAFKKANAEMRAVAASAASVAQN